ncbi:MAG: PadR family transcriptional regulator [Acidobacteriota bacterium]
MNQLSSDLLRGTLDMLVLQVLSEGPSHGYAIGQRLGELTDGDLSVEQGSLYPALYRLEKASLLKSSWSRNPESNRRARVYRLTAAGKRRLNREVDGWMAFVHTISRVVPSK